MIVAPVMWVGVSGASCYLVATGLRDRTKWRRLVGAIGLMLGLNGVAFSTLMSLREVAGMATLQRWIPLLVLAAVVGTWVFVARLLVLRRRARSGAGQVLMTVQPVRRERVVIALQCGILCFMVLLAILQAVLLNGEPLNAFRFMPIGLVILFLPSIALMALRATLTQEGLVDNHTFIPWKNITDYAWSTREGPHLTVFFSSEYAFGGRRFEPAGTHRWPVRLEQVEDIQAILDQHVVLKSLDSHPSDDQRPGQAIDLLATDGTTSGREAYLQ